jgi:transposase
MRGRSRCKENFAAHVNKIMPGRIELSRRRDALRARLVPKIFMHASRQDREFSLIFPSCKSIIIFTEALRDDLLMAQKRNSDPKDLALRQQGALNPHPEQVTDELFLTNEFFDTRDLVQVKYEMLCRVRSEGQSVSRAAIAFGFSRPSFYQTQASFEQGGLPALIPQKRGPKEAHKLTNAVLAFVRQLREEDPSLRPADLATRLRQTYGITVHPRSIERALARSQKKLR